MRASPARRRERRPRVASVCAAGLALAAFGCAEVDRDETAWTVGRAESVTTIRGMPVRVRQCHGLGTPGDGEMRRYRRFACVAGTRLRGEPYDTVAVLYVIRVLPSGGHALDNVRFLGLGVP